LNTATLITATSDLFMEYAFGAMLILIGVEAFVSYWKKKDYYHINVLIADVSNGIIFALAGIGILVGALFVYDLIEKNFSLNLIGIVLFPLESPFSFSPFTIHWNYLASWTLALVLVDFIYYWFHRHAHTLNILWACHVTHHSAEDMNLSVAFRGNAFQRIFEYIYFFPLAMLGMPWEIFFFCHRILKVYQFFVHTRFFGKLGFYEYLMVTPSSHRVHHGTERKYLDKNHGGIFIIWDKMFGSFVEEKEEPLYGLTKPVRTFNPITANIHVYSEIIQNVKKARTLSDKLKLIFYEPGWKPDYMKTPEDVFKEPAYTVKYNPNTPQNVMVYVGLQAIVLASVGLLIWKITKLDITQGWPLVIVGLFVIFSLVSINRTMEMKKWSKRSEVIRNVILVSFLISVGFFFKVSGVLYFSIPLLILSLASLIWIVVKRKTFYSDTLATS
jgi:alkylglycerol monooxygenase